MACTSRSTRARGAEGAAPDRCGRASCQRRSGSSTPWPTHGQGRTRGDLFANSRVMFTPSSGGAVDARPPLKSAGMVRSRTRSGAPFHVTVRHLCFKGGRVKIASTGAEEAAAEQGHDARRFRGDASGARRGQADRAGAQPTGRRCRGRRRHRHSGGRARRARGLHRSDRVPAAGHPRAAEPAGGHPRALPRRRA